MRVDSSVVHQTLPPPPPPEATSGVVAVEADTGEDTPAVAPEGVPGSNGLLHGQGNKTGILKRMTTDDIVALQGSLAPKAQATADEIVASRAAEEPDATVDAEAPVDESDGGEAGAGGGTIAIDGSGLTLADGDGGSGPSVVEQVSAQLQEAAADDAAQEAGEYDPLSEFVERADRGEG